ncbi:MAG: flagellar hook-length control protein FliK [Cellvibrionaceae bacterium]|nr:flagellar hook-length control protein FliK [Cellvibrionaceae bacterium]
MASIPSELLLLPARESAVNAKPVRPSLPAASFGEQLHQASTGGRQPDDQRPAPEPRRHKQDKPEATQPVARAERPSASSPSAPVDAAKAPQDTTAANTADAASVQPMDDGTGALEQGSVLSLSAELLQQDHSVSDLGLGVDSGPLTAELLPIAELPLEDGGEPVAGDELLAQMRNQVGADLEAALLPEAAQLQLVSGDIAKTQQALGAGVATAAVATVGQLLPQKQNLDQAQSLDLAAELDLEAGLEGEAEPAFELKSLGLNATKAGSAESTGNKPTAEALLQSLSAIKSSGAEQGYQQASGAQLVYSQGQLTGLQHSFTLQRDGAVQGQSLMQSNLSQGQWSAEVAEKVAWFSARNISTAQIRLDPPELGSLQIKIQLNQEQAQVSFSSPHASVREALDQTSVRLRELFEQQGLDLLDVNVGSEQSEGFEGEEGGSMFADADQAEAEVESQAPQQPLRAKGLVDSYA